MLSIAAEALRHRAAEEGRSMHEVVRTALDEYLLGTDDDEVTNRVADKAHAATPSYCAASASDSPRPSRRLRALRAQCPRVRCEGVPLA